MLFFVVHLQYPNTRYCFQNKEPQSIEKNGSEHSPTLEEVDADSNTFYPKSVEDIPYEGKDLLKRLLEVNLRFRLKSVMALQKISMYMNFNIEESYVLQHSPLEIMEKHGVCISALNKENGSFENF